MSDAVVTLLLEIIKTIGIVAAPILTVILTYQLARAKKSMKAEVVAVKEEVVTHVAAVKEDVAVLKTEINGRMTQLIESKEEAAGRKGREAGKAEQKAEDKKKK